ncbi:unnamed protein product [Closterium sp. NIES-65]|nr:unnamed protein product [Closterium sp. NIES-65]
MQNRTLEKQGLDASSVYNLFLYREGRAWGGSSSEEEEKKSLCGTVPVLFIPGNAGCYKQVRSLASVSHHIYHASHAQHESRNSPPCFACSDEPDTEPLTPAKPAADSDGKKESGEARGEAAAGTWKGGRGSAAYPSRLVWFSVDLREHLSALHSALLHKQAAFVAAAVTQHLSALHSALLHKQAAFVAAAIIQMLALHYLQLIPLSLQFQFLLFPLPCAAIVGHLMRILFFLGPLYPLPLSFLLCLHAYTPAPCAASGAFNGGDSRAGPQETHRGGRCERGRGREGHVEREGEDTQTTHLILSRYCSSCFHARSPVLCAASGAFNGGDSDVAAWPTGDSQGEETRERNLGCLRNHNPATLCLGCGLFPLPLQPSMHALYHSLIQHTPNSPSSALLLASLAAGRSDWQVRLAGEIGLVPRVSLPLVALPSHTHTNPTPPSALPPPLCSSHRFLLAEEIGR